MTPPWAALLDAPADWQWQGARLVAPGAARASPQGSAARRFVVRHLYATQNSSAAVRRALGALLAGLGEGEYGLDLADVAEADIVATAARLPFRDGTLALVVAQEVFEHLPDPQATLAEILRVLKPGGAVYLQTPWMLGWHSGPQDFWRFSQEGMAKLFGTGWRVETVVPSLGHGSGFYRVAVEYAAVTASALWGRLYLPAKAAAALLFIPFRWADALSSRSPEAHRIAGGFYAIARKVA